MCGGSVADFTKVESVLKVIGKAVTHVGPVGSGQITKAVNQVIIAGVYQSVAEGISLAKCAGLDPRKVIEAIGAGAARSWVLENRANNMIEDCYPLGFRLKLHLKDLRIALATAEATGADLPVAKVVADTETRLLSEGFGDSDMSAIAVAVRRASHLIDGPL
jgi:3-hydroxyisobutyrate dehydrogenase